MKKHNLIAIFVWVLWGVFSSTPLMAAPQSDVYKVSIRNLQFGELTFTHDFNNGKYEAKASFKTKSLAGALFNITFEGEAKGRGVAFGRYFPDTVKYRLDRDGEMQSYSLIFENEILKERIYSPRLYPDIDPQTQAGAIDPLTAMALIFRELPFDRVCGLSVQTFDGLRSNQVILGPPIQRQDGRFQCNGGITNLNGYSSDSENFTKDQYFTALYRLNRSTGQFVLDRILGQSPYGQYEIVRQ